MGIHSHPLHLPIFIPQSDFSSILSNTESSNSFTFRHFGESTSQIQLNWDPSSMSLLDSTLTDMNHSFKYRDSKSFIYEYENTNTIIQSPIQVFKTESPIYAMDTNADDSLMILGGRKLALFDPTLQVWRNPFQGHVSDITSCRFFPSQQVILSASLDMTLRIWGLDGSNPMTLKGHGGGVLDTGIISRGRNVVSCSRDGSLKLWEVSSGQVIHSFQPHLGPLYSLSLNSYPCLSDKNQMSTDSSHLQDAREVDTGDKRVFVGGHNGLYGLDLGSKQSIYSLSSESPICSVDFDGKYIVYGNVNGIVTILDASHMASPLYEFQRSNASIENVKLCRLKDMDCVLVTSSDGSCALIDFIHSHIVFELTGSDRDNLKACSILSMDSKTLKVKTGGRLGMLNCFLLQM